LIEVLLNADRNHVNHQKGNGTVATEMKEKFEGDFCIGIIDEDRKELDYLNEFDLVCETNYLKLWKHIVKHHFIIRLRPVIEKWLTTICSENGIVLKHYSLPASWKDLIRITKSVSSKKDQRFIQLFKEMKRERLSPFCSCSIGWNI